ncbi:hypothetical protein Bbelb_001940 [Branchiostoma belcheri]|nr:hypothetical protein Bbelb_001940 [Branchiostoma belcheri]
MQADKLSEQQIIEYREAFSVYDKDGDGIIAIKELFKVMWSLGQNPTESEMEKILQDVDPDNDFRVDCELCRHWGLSRRTGAKQNCAGGVEERRGRSRFFAGAKQNGAGAKQNGGGEEEGVSWG